MKLVNYLKGKKTYLLTVLTYVFAVSAYATGHLGLREAANLLFGGTYAATLRAGISNSVAKVVAAYNVNSTLSTTDVPQG